MTFALAPKQEALRAKARDVAERVIAPRAAEVDRTEQYPWDNVAALTDAGFMGMTVPKAYGGPGLSYLDTALVIEEMAAHCGVTGRVVVEGNMGAISAILQYGTESQKARAAAMVLAGDKPAICITEPDAGSAATQMTTRADKGDLKGWRRRHRAAWFSAVLGLRVRTMLVGVASLIGDSDISEEVPSVIQVASAAAVVVVIAIHHVLWRQGEVPSSASDADPVRKDLGS